MGSRKTLDPFDFHPKGGVCQIEVRFAPFTLRSKRLGPVKNEPPSSAKYMLEMARTYSLDNNGAPVLCEHFFPGVDLLIVADAYYPSISTPRALQCRFNSIHDAIEATRVEINNGQDWLKQVFTFGLLRWWATSMRDKAAIGLGPFHYVINCGHEAKCTMDRDGRLVPMSPQGITPTADSTGG